MQDMKPRACLPLKTASILSMKILRRAARREDALLMSALKRAILNNNIRVRSLSTSKRCIQVKEIL
jgi:hypothetical protein